MPTMQWSERVAGLSSLLQRMECTDGKGRTLVHDAALARWREQCLDIRSANRTVFLVGNGASASMASHFAADLSKNARVHTEVFTDLAQLTAIANDIGYDEVFSVPLRFHMKQGDMLVAISSSGRSPNVLRAVEAAHAMGGLAVTLSAMDADNPLRLRGDLNFHVAATDYGMAETAHAAVLHHWMDSL